MSIQPGSVQRINTPTRRDVLKATMGVMIATLWGGSPAYAEEERMKNYNEILCTTFRVDV
jgi:hypothetical protein